MFIPTCPFGKGLFLQLSLESAGRNVHRPAENSSYKHCCEIFFRSADCHKVEFLVKKIEHARRQKSRECRSDANVANSQVEEREQHRYGFLLIPGENERERQLIDA